jgi:hypothetical protein
MEHSTRRPAPPCPSNSSSCSRFYSIILGPESKLLSFRSTRKYGNIHVLQSWGCPPAANHRTLLELTVVPCAKTSRTRPCRTTMTSYSNSLALITGLILFTPISATRNRTYLHSPLLVWSTTHAKSLPQDTYHGDKVDIPASHTQLLQLLTVPRYES